MNNKGFTLIELIATILVLCLISLIAVTSINKVVKDSNANGHKAQVENILTSCMTYVSVNNDIKLSDMNNLVIHLDELVDNGYLDKEIKDPNNNKIINMESSYITITEETNTSKTDGKKLDYKYDGNHLYILTLVYK